jgi:hypothetical protein
MKIAVVFIHGFTGGSGTWKNSEDKSFKDLLVEDKAIAESFDFFEFEYFTKIVNIENTAAFQKLLGLWDWLIQAKKRKSEIKKNQEIRHLSEQLTSYLRFNLSNYSKVILITHSMGGLIGKQYILSHPDNSGPTPIGYVSLAVPHKGILSAMLFAPLCNINTNELIPLSDYTDNLNNQWNANKQSLPPCLYVIAQHDEVVHRNSAIPFAISGSDKVVADHDHTSICKPTNTNDTAFLAAKSFLQRIAYSEKMTEVVATAALSNKPDYDKEIFVIKMMVCDIGPQGIEDAKDCFFNAEIVSKSANKDDAAQIALLKESVLSIYRQKYNSFHGTSESSNNIFSAVHEEITKHDKNALQSSVAYLNFLHKKGLLHQAANELTQKVIWSSDADYLDKIKKAFE